MEDLTEWKDQEQVNYCYQDLLVGSSVIKPSSMSLKMFLKVKSTVKQFAFRFDWARHGGHIH